MSASQSNNTNALHLTSIEMRHVRERKLETNLYGWNLFNPDEKLSEDEINANSKVLEGMLFLVTAVENHNYDDLNWRIRIPRCPEGPLSKKGCLEYLLASLIKPSIMDSILIPTVELDDLLNSDDSGEIWILTSPVTEDNKTRIYEVLESHPWKFQDDVINQTELRSTTNVLKFVCTLLVNRFSDLITNAQIPETSLTYQQLISIAMEGSSSSDPEWCIRMPDDNLRGLQTKPYSYYLELAYEIDRSGEKSAETIEDRETKIEFFSSRDDDQVREQWEETWKVDGEIKVARLSDMKKMGMGYGTFRSFNFVEDFLGSVLWRKEMLKTFLDPNLLVQTVLQLNWVRGASGWSVGSFWTENDRNNGLAGFKSGITMEERRWLQCLRHCDKPLLLILNYDVELEQRNVRRWSAVMYSAPTPTARKNTGTSSSSAGTASSSAESTTGVVTRSHAQAQSGTTVSANGAGSSIFGVGSGGSGRGMGGKGLCVIDRSIRIDVPQSTESSDSELFALPIQPGRKGFAIVYEGSSRSKGLLILCFFSGTYTKSGSAKMVAQWKAECERSNVVLAIMHSIHKMDAHTSMRLLMSELGSIWRHGFRDIFVHCVTHSSQLKSETSHVLGKVIWMGASINEAESLNGFLRLIVHYLAETFPVHNVLLCLASCNLKDCLQSNPLLSRRMVALVEEKQLASFSIIASLQPNLEESVASNPQIWMPIVTNWMDESKETFQIETRFPVKAVLFKASSTPN